jgi:hypothetical protein
VHQGDSLPIEFLNSIEPPLRTRAQLTLLDKTKATATIGATLGPWVVKHREGVTNLSLNPSSLLFEQFLEPEKLAQLGSVGEDDMRFSQHKATSMLHMHAIHLLSPSQVTSILLQSH